MINDLKLGIPVPHSEKTNASVLALVLICVAPYDLAKSSGFQG
jgi:hypothetical protein